MRKPFKKRQNRPTLMKLEKKFNGLDKVPKCFKRERSFTGSAISIFIICEYAEILSQYKLKQTHGREIDLRPQNIHWQCL